MIVYFCFHIWTGCIFKLVMECWTEHSVWSVWSRFDAIFNNWVIFPVYCYYIWWFYLIFFLFLFFVSYMLLSHFNLVRLDAAADVIPMWQWKNPSILWLLTRPNTCFGFLFHHISGWHIALQNLSHKNSSDKMLVCLVSKPAKP